MGKGSGSNQKKTFKGSKGVNPKIRTSANRSIRQAKKALRRLGDDPGQEKRRDKLGAHISRMESLAIKA